MADVFTQDGEELIADLVSADSFWIGWGTGAGTASKSSSTLNTEVGTRQSAVVTQPLADQNQFVATLTSSGANTITNAGVFDASTAGVLMLHSDFTGIPLADTETIEFTFLITWS